MINLETELKQQTLINTTLKQSNISLVQTDLQRIQTLETRLNSALDYKTNSAQTDLQIQNSIQNLETRLSAALEHQNIENSNFLRTFEANWHKEK